MGEGGGWIGLEGCVLVFKVDIPKQDIQDVDMGVKTRILVDHMVRGFELNLSTLSQEGHETYQTSTTTARTSLTSFALSKTNLPAKKQAYN